VSRLAEPIRRRILADSVRLAFAAIILLSVASVLLLPTVTPAWRDVFGRVVAGFTVELVAIALLRQVLPRPAPGLHRVGKSDDHVVWLLSAALAEVAMARPFRGPYWLLASTRCLYLRALGAEIAWSASVAPDVVIRDPVLVRIGAGARLEPGACLDTVVHEAGRIHVGQISVGHDVTLGQQCVVLPGASIAHEARIGAGAIVGVEARVGIGASVGARAVIGDRVLLGAYAVVGAGAVIAEGAQIGDRARIMPGAVVPHDTVVNDREVVPAAGTTVIAPSAPSSVSLRVVE
jgi:carbonic anhydrase/acetyltransferase-like protein (isoleucine patch superfamily)